jgi:hypothetical protein
LLATISEQCLYDRALDLRRTLLSQLWQDSGPQEVFIISIGVGPITARHLLKKAPRVSSKVASSRPVGFVTIAQRVAGFEQFVLDHLLSPTIKVLSKSATIL